MMFFFVLYTTSYWRIFRKIRLIDAQVCAGFLQLSSAFIFLGVIDFPLSSLSRLESFLATQPELLINDRKISFPYYSFLPANDIAYLFENIDHARLQLASIDFSFLTMVHTAMLFSFFLESAKQRQMMFLDCSYRSTVSSYVCQSFYRSIHSIVMTSACQ